MYGFTIITNKYTKHQFICLLMATRDTKTAKIIKGYITHHHIAELSMCC